MKFKLQTAITAEQVMSLFEIQLMHNIFQRLCDQSPSSFVEGELSTADNGIQSNTLLG